MNKWQTEKLVAFNIPFLERVNKKKHHFYNEIIDNSNCCSLILNNYTTNFDFIGPSYITIYGNFRNSYFISRTQFFTEKVSGTDFESLICFHNNDCDNILDLNIVIQDGETLYFFSKQMKLCKIMQENTNFVKTCKLNENVFYTKSEHRKKGNKYIEVEYNLFSTKQDGDIHFYNDTEDTDECAKKNHCDDAEKISEVSKKIFEVEYDSISYNFDCFICIFCDRVYETIYSLQKHIFLAHFYHKLIFKDAKYLLIEKSDEELSNARLTGLAVLKNTTLKMIDSKNKHSEYYQIDLYFVKFTYKRRHTNKKFQMKKKHYTKEILTACDSYIVVDWLVEQKKQQICEFVDIEPEKLKIMILWNTFILKQKLQVNNFNLCSYLIQFFKKIPRSPHMIDFITMIYKKKLITQNDVQEILLNVTNTSLVP